MTKARGRSSEALRDSFADSGAVRYTDEGLEQDFNSLDAQRGGRRILYHQPPVLVRFPTKSLARRSYPVKGASRFLCTESYRLQVLGRREAGQQ